MQDKERFNNICAQVIKRTGIDKLLEWLERSDFYTCPASTRFHGAFPGGLLEHSLNVYDELYRLLKVYPEIQVPEDSVAVASLFHDLCKVNFYSVEKRNRKNEAGQWESYDFYTVKEKFCYGGHGSKSVFILSQFITLSADEAVAINCHMGPWEGTKEVGNAYAQFPFAWLLHVADEAASYLIESKI